MAKEWGLASPQRRNMACNKASGVGSSLSTERIVEFNVLKICSKLLASLLLRLPSWHSIMASALKAANPTWGTREVWLFWLGAGWVSCVPTCDWCVLVGLLSSSVCSKLVPSSPWWTSSSGLSPNSICSQVGVCACNCRESFPKNNTSVFKSHLGLNKCWRCDKHICTENWAAKSTHALNMCLQGWPQLVTLGQVQPWICGLSLDCMNTVTVLSFSVSTFLFTVITKEQPSSTVPKFAQSLTKAV